MKRSEETWRVGTWMFWRFVWMFGWCSALVSLVLKAKDLPRWLAQGTQTDCRGEHCLGRSYAIFDTFFWHLFWHLFISFLKCVFLFHGSQPVGIWLELDLRMKWERGVWGGGGGNGPKITPFQCKLGGRGGTLARWGNGWQFCDGKLSIPPWSAFGGGFCDVYFEEDDKQGKYRVVEVQKVKKLGKKRVFVVESCGRSIPRGSICRGVKRGKKLGE